MGGWPFYLLLLIIYLYLLLSLHLIISDYGTSFFLFCFLIFFLVIIYLFKISIYYRDHDFFFPWIAWVVESICYTLLVALLGFVKSLLNFILLIISKIKSNIFTSPLRWGNKDAFYYFLFFLYLICFSWNKMGY